MRIICYPNELFTEQSIQIEGFSYKQYRFKIRIENITDHEISFDCQIFAEPSFSENFIESNHAKLCSNSGVFPLEAGKGYTINGIYSIRDSATLNADELALYNKTKVIFYCEFSIEGKWAFVKTNLPPYVIRSDNALRANSLGDNMEGGLFCR